MKKTAALFSLFLISLFATGQNGLTCYTIPTAVLPNGTVANGKQMAADSSGKILICSYGAGLIILDGLIFSNYTQSNSGIASNNILDVATSSTSYFIATYDKGLSVYDGVNWMNYDSLNSGLISNRLSCVVAKGNDVFIGSTKYGFSILSNGIITNYNRSNSGLNCDTILDFAQDNSGVLWIATARGLNKLESAVISKPTIIAETTSLIYKAYLFFDGSSLWYFNGSFFKIENNVSVNFSDNFDSAWNLTMQGRPLGLGPMGGLLFISELGFSEIFNNKLYNYQVHPLNCSFNNPSPFLFCDPKSGLVWCKGYTPNLASFEIDSFPPPILQSQSCRSLDVNNVKAAMLNRGDMFWNLKDVKYEVPKGSGKHTIFSSALWLGGLDLGKNLHVAAMTYRLGGNDFWPGPLDTITGTIDTATMLKYDKIWKVDKFQIEQFKYAFQKGWVQNGSFMPADDILTWPAAGSGSYTRKMAPFIDVNQDGEYNPMTGGDYPLIKGDQMLYWIFNDNFSYHTETDGTPLKLEVHASAYSYSCPNLITRDSIINYTSFYNYKIFNRNILNFDSCFLSIWTDFDIGNPNDDRVGTHAADNFVYSCNFDENDEGNGVNSYGLNPPIMSNVILNGPLALPNDTVDNNHDGMTDEPGEKNLLTNTLCYHNTFSFSGNPSAASHYYSYIKSVWKGNHTLTYDTAIFGTRPTKYMYPSFPSDSMGWFQTFAIDERILASSGPFLFPAGSSFDYDFAFVFSRDTTLAYNSPAYYQMAVNDVQRVKYWFDNNNAPSCLVFPGVPETQLYNNNMLIFPNPANTLLNIQFRNAAAIDLVVVFDLMGKQVKSSYTKNATKSQVQLNVQSFTPGIYFIGLLDKTGKYSYSKFIKE